MMFLNSILSKFVARILHSVSRGPLTCALAISLARWRFAPRFLILTICVWKSDKNKEGRKGSAGGVALAQSHRFSKTPFQKSARSLARPKWMSVIAAATVYPGFNPPPRRTPLNSGDDEMPMIPLAAIDKWMDGCVFVWARFISVAPGGPSSCAALLCPLAARRGADASSLPI